MQKKKQSSTGKSTSRTHESFLSKTEKTYAAKLDYLVSYVHILIGVSLSKSQTGWKICAWRCVLHFPSKCSWWSLFPYTNCYCYCVHVMMYVGTRTAGEGKTAQEDGRLANVTFRVSYRGDARNIPPPLQKRFSTPLRKKIIAFRVFFYTDFVALIKRSQINDANKSTNYNSYIVLIVIHLLYS